MADELQTQSTFTYNKSPLQFRRELVQKITCNGNALHHTVQTIGSTAENIVIPGDISSPGIGYLVNVGAQDVDIGKDVSAVFEKLFTVKVGEYCGPFRIASGVTLQGKTASSTSDLEIYVQQN